jgi:predicted phosphodiesterase
VADDEVVCLDGSRVLRRWGLAPDREVTIAPLSVRTLPRPPGSLLATVATVNDCHFGETVCGLMEDLDLGPVLSVEPGQRPYPEVMNRAAAAEIAATEPAAVIAKGDLTGTGADEEYRAFVECYGSLFGSRLVVTRGNHDQRSPEGMAFPRVQEVRVPGAILAVLETFRPGRGGGALDRGQLDWLDEVGRRADSPVLVFGHHPVSVEGSLVLRPGWVLDTWSTQGLVEVMARRSALVGYFAGHTHRNRVHRLAAADAVPFAEVASVKDFPGSWAEYRIFDGGILAIHRRICTDAPALAWSERCRALYGGLYPDYALGRLEDRCYVVC